MAEVSDHSELNLSDLQSMQINSEVKLSPLPGNIRSSNVSNITTGQPDDGVRYIILIDMDAYYAQVEMKRHNLDPAKPMAVQ